MKYTFNLNLSIAYSNIFSFGLNLSMQLCLGFFIIHFSSNAQAPKNMFYPKTDSILNSKFNQDWQQYTLSNPQIPATFTNKKGNEFSFDGFGSNQQPQFIQTCNNLDAAKTLGTQKLWNGGSLGLNLSGSGMNLLGMWDGGAARTTHQELAGRVTVMDGATLSAHSTAVAGNLIATGINANAKGMAFQTQLKNWNFSNDNAEVIAAASDLLISNHSYAGTTAWQFISGSWYWYGDSSLHQFEDWKFGYYDNRSRIADSVMAANPYYLMVKAAGNDRGSGVAPGTTHHYWNGTAWALTNTTRDTVGPYDCLSTSANAKNALTIGAINVLPNGFTDPSQVSLLSFSSWGPTDDGRIKPDLVGASGSILTTTSTGDADYANLGGTSIATPNVAGSLLLLQQYFNRINGRYLRNATLKGLAIHTANRCKSNPGPDYECGWGIPNLEKAALCIHDSFYNTIIEDTLHNLDSFSVDVFVNPEDTLRITLCWTDPKGVTVAPVCDNINPKLINDLDVKLVKQNGTTIALPFVLDPANPSQIATKGNNVRDNVEQIYAPNLDPGVYTIKVKHKGNLQNNSVQTFSLLFSGAPEVYDTLPAVWIGLVNSSWQEAGNWYGNVIPASNASVVLPSAPHNPRISTLQSVANLTIHNGVTLTLNSTLELSRTLLCEGIIDADSGILTLNGNVAQSIGEDAFMAGVLFGLNLNNAAGVSLNDTINLTGTLILIQGTLTTNGFLFLKSDASSTARIATVGSGNLSGNLWVERYIPSRRAFRFLASPVTTVNGIDDNWQQQTHITGVGGASNGFDPSTLNSASMFTLDAGSQNWNAISNTQSANLNQGVGYRLMVRGNRSTDLNSQQAAPSAVVLVAVGTHSIGNKTYNTSSSPALTGTIGHFSFIGNPFPSSIDWNSISRTNVSGTFYTWNAQIGSNGRGAYVNFNATGNISSDGNVNQYIGSGSAFMVQTSGSSPSLTIEEQDKVSNEQGSQMLGKSKDLGLRIHLLENDSQIVDALYVYQNDLANDQLDAFDSEKWLNPGLSFYSLTSEGKKVSIQGFKELLQGREIALGMENPEFKNYTLQFREWKHQDWQLVLMDQFKQTKTIIETPALYSFSVNDNQASGAINRFKLMFQQKVTGIATREQIPEIHMFPNPSTHSISLQIRNSKGSNYQYQISNHLGQEFEQGSLNFEKQSRHELSIENLCSGIYFIRLSNPEAIQTIKFVKL